MRPGHYAMLVGYTIVVIAGILELAQRSSLYGVFMVVFGVIAILAVFVERYMNSRK